MYVLPGICLFIGGVRGIAPVLTAKICRRFTQVKTSNKILSAFLAFALVISSAFAAFAFSNKEVTYTAKYEGNATRGTYAGILQDANDMLAGVAFTGDTLATLWGVVPGMTRRT